MTQQHFHIQVISYTDPNIEDNVLNETMVAALHRLKFDTLAQAREALRALLKKCAPFNNAQVWLTESDPDARLLDLLDWEYHELVELTINRIGEDVESCFMCDGQPITMTLYDICQFGMQYDESVEERNVPPRKE